jgi:hypothetical protein
MNAADATLVSHPTTASDLASVVVDDYAVDAQLQGIARPYREAFLRFPTVGQASQIQVVEGIQAHAGQRRRRSDRGGVTSENRSSRGLRQTCIANLEAPLQLAIAKQGQMTVTAPFEGQVIWVAAKQDNSVDTTTPVVQIADLSLLEVELHLPS